ncbi:hypothetical protein SAMN05216228_101933 [Rhizobium tibeticum]|uniref:Uncharacterized protein n=1 Tax=Rhizobium tibeticum TaxID=501024 RepID=A0A1H8QHL7_9HYPH|nr:hypothetical protein RTCCBAU85039_3975 [Rhizobium tibeticum]SEO53538.1 hypothetical protein SAMN05216228_101933 [Rhizobium tibeticum]
MPDGFIAIKAASSRLQWATEVPTSGLAITGLHIGHLDQIAQHIGVLSSAICLMEAMFSCEPDRPVSFFANLAAMG